MQMVLHYLGFKEIFKKTSLQNASDDEDAGASESGEVESLRKEEERGRRGSLRSGKNVN